MSNPRAYRLPTHVLPRRYDVHLDARPGRETFHGRLAIALDVREPTRVVETHARGLTLTDARAVVGGRVVPATLTAHPDRDTVEFEFPEDLPAGQSSLEVAFEGKVSSSMGGLYMARDGPEWMMATQFQSTDARAVFPCFDEPAFKAQVAWTVTTDAGLIVLANSPLKDVSDGDGSRTWRFEATRPISVYLAAIAIGDIAATPEERVAGVPLRVWAIRGKESLGEFSQRFTARLLPWFEEYFATPYPYGKYDQIAVPGFSAGAMENIGLVTFRQPYLLMNPRTASWREERQIARVVAHEFAHMWFGNLVTLQWWDDTWLNESFAEWMAHKAVDALEPRYRVWDTQMAERMAALQKDSLDSTHAIYAPIETPEQVHEIFDAITYYKGASVMRMLETFLGEDAFRAGLRTYMREFAERNATGADLWRHLKAASGEPVDRIMGSWITEPGHPVVRVGLEEDESGARLRLSQRRFYFAPRPVVASEPVWPVPIVARYEDDAGVHESRFLFSDRDAVFPLDARGHVHWVTANAHGIGVYRQDPDDGVINRLLAHRDALEPAEAAALLDDQWGLARNGTRSISRFLDVLAAVSSTANDHAVLERIVGALRELEDQVVDSGDAAAAEGFRAWVRDTFRPKLEEVGLDPRAGESPADAQRRVALVEAVAAIGRDEAAVRDAVALADREAADAASVDANLAPLVVAVASKFGDRARLDRHVGIYESRRAAGASPAETDRYLNSFPSFEDPAVVKQVLRLMDERVLPQESWGPLLRRMLGLRHARVEAWRHVTTHWEHLRKSLGDMWMVGLVEATGGLPHAFRPEMVAFFDATLKGLGEQSRARALEALDQRHEFRARTQGDVVQWFRKYAPG